HSSCCSRMNAVTSAGDIGRQLNEACLPPPTRSLEYRKEGRLGRRRHILAIPPAAAESLEQRSRVGVAISLGLNKADQGLLIGLLRIEQQQIIDIAELQPPARDGEASGGGALGDHGLLQGDGVCS